MVIDCADPRCEEHAHGDPWFHKEEEMGLTIKSRKPSTKAGQNFTDSHAGLIFYDSYGVERSAQQIVVEIEGEARRQERDQILDGLRRWGNPIPREPCDHAWVENSDWNGGPSDTAITQCMKCNAVKPQ